MIWDFARRPLRPLVRAARRVTLRLSGYSELASRLDSQDAVLRRLEETVGSLHASLAEFRRDLSGRDAQRSAEAQLDAERRTLESAALRDKLEQISRDQATLRAEATAALKAAETAVTEALTGEIDRLDGYVLYHASDIRSAVKELSRRLEPHAAGRSDGPNQPLLKAG